MGRQVQTAGVGMRKGFGGVQGEQRWETALAQPPPQGLGPPRLFGVVGESPPPPPPSAPCVCPPPAPGGTRLPPGDTATPGGHCYPRPRLFPHPHPPGTQGLPSGNSFRGSPRDAPARERWGDPDGGIPRGRGGRTHGPGGRRWLPPGSASPIRPG